MEYIDIDNRDYNYSNDEIFIVLKDHIEYKEKIYNDDGDEVDLYHRLMVVCAATGYLTDGKLLNHTIDYLKIYDLIDDIKNTGIDLSSYSEKDVMKIKAIYYSLSSLYKLNIKALKFPNSKDPIRFDIVLKDRVIEHNLSEVIKSIQKNGVNQFKVNISSMPINCQKNEINKWIRSALDISFDKDIKIFDKDIKHLEKISNYLIEIETPKKSQFSVLEWATIFYYADSCKYFNQKNMIEKQAFFMKEHKITTSKKSFKNKVIGVKNTINKTHIYSIDKLNHILPFVKEKYSKGVTLIENDKVYLDENNKKEDDY